MKKTIIFSLSLLFPVFVYSQQLTQTIKGKVLDAESLQPLIGANVIVENTDPVIGATTDASGYFRLVRVPIGRQTVKVSYIGYETAVIPELLVGSAKELEIEVKLDESALSLGAITVSGSKNNKALNEMATIGARSFSVEETHRYAASINDPGRMALSYAGVTNGDDASNQIIVRGNSPNGLLWRLEGVEIPSPSHFAEEGNPAGFVSILNSNMLSTSDFYIGAFPAEYNNAYSGVFDIRLRNGNSDKHEYAFKFGLMGTDITMEGPFNKKSSASFLVNYRYSTFAILHDIGINVMGDAVPRYQDMSFKIHLPTKNAGTFSIWGIGGLSSNKDANPVKDSTIWKENSDRETWNFNSGMGALGITHLYRLGAKSYVRSVASLSDKYNQEDDYQLLSNYDLQKTYHGRFDNAAFRINSFYNVKFNSKLTSRTGFDFNVIRLNMFAKNRQYGSLRTTDNTNGKTSEVYVFNQNKYRVKDDLTIDLGLSYAYFALGHSHSLEPKASVEWAFSPKQTIGFATGIYSRHEELSAYFMVIPVNDSVYIYPNKRLKLKKTAHFVLSYNYAINNHLSFKAEMYYQHLYDFPVLKDKGSTFSTIAQSWFGGWDADSLVSNGIGRNYGLELTLEKRFSNHNYFMATASLFDSKFRAADGNWYNTQFNSNYAFNLIGGKEYILGKEKNKMLNINGKIIYAGGQRYTPVDMEATINTGEVVFFEKQRNAKQFPDYFRIDLGINYRINKEKAAHIFALDIQNVTNRKNIQGMYYDTFSRKINFYYNFALVPVLSYKIEF